MEGGAEMLTTRYWKSVHSSKKQLWKSLPGIPARGSCLVAVGAFLSVCEGEHSSLKFHLRCTLPVHQESSTDVTRPSAFKHLQYHCCQWQPMLFGREATGMVPAPLPSTLLLGCR